MFVLFYNVPGGEVWWTPPLDDSDVPRPDRSQFHGELPKHLLIPPRSRRKGEGKREA